MSQGLVAEQHPQPVEGTPLQGWVGVGPGGGAYLKNRIITNLCPT